MTDAHTFTQGFNAFTTNLNNLLQNTEPHPFTIDHFKNTLQQAIFRANQAAVQTSYLCNLFLLHCFQNNQLADCKITQGFIKTAMTLLSTGTGHAGAKQLTLVHVYQHIFRPLGFPLPDGSKLSQVRSAVATELETNFNVFLTNSRGMSVAAVECIQKRFHLKKSAAKSVWFSAYCKLLPAPTFFGYQRDFYSQKLKPALDAVKEIIYNECYPCTKEMELLFYVWKMCQNENVRMNTVFPVRQSKVGFIRFDKFALKDLFSLPKGFLAPEKFFQNVIWSSLPTKQVRRINIDYWNVASFSTDGVRVCTTMIQNKEGKKAAAAASTREQMQTTRKRKRTTTNQMTDLPSRGQFELENLHPSLVCHENKIIGEVFDPGVVNLLSGNEGTLLSLKEYRAISGFRQTNKRHAQRRAQKKSEQEFSLKELDATLTPWNNANTEKYCESLASRQCCWDQWWFAVKDPYYRQLDFHAKSKKQRVMSRIANMAYHRGSYPALPTKEELESKVPITKQSVRKRPKITHENENSVVFVGSGSWCSGQKKHGPTPVQGIKETLAKNGLLILVKEHLTSQRCYTCHNKMNSVYSGVSYQRKCSCGFVFNGRERSCGNCLLERGKYAKRDRNVLNCKSCDMLRDRDLNASLNIAFIVEHYNVSGEYHVDFRPANQNKEEEEEEENMSGEQRKRSNLGNDVAAEL